jgi:hypothetical protein
MALWLAATGFTASGGSADTLGGGQVNKISPKAVRKINSSTMPFAQRENIQNFCDAVARLGVKDINCFAADDLFEGKNLKQVSPAPQLCSLPTLETTQEQTDGYVSQLPFKCYLSEVASVGDLLKLYPWVASRVAARRDSLLGRVGRRSRS